MLPVSNNTSTMLCIDLVLDIASATFRTVCVRVRVRFTSAVKTWPIFLQVGTEFKLLVEIKVYSHQLMHFLIQLCISLLSYIKIT
jgi:hypothetical protein